MTLLDGAPSSIVRGEDVTAGAIINREHPLPVYLPRETTLGEDGHTPLADGGVIDNGHPIPVWMPKATSYRKLFPVGNWYLRLGEQEQ